MIRAVNVALWFYWNSFPLEIIRQQSWELLKRGGKCYHINCDGEVIGVTWGNIEGELLLRWEAILVTLGSSL